MTLKSKKILSNQKNHRINIRSKQRGGSKYTIVGHAKKGATANKSDLTSSDVYFLSKYDVNVVEDFLRNVKGDNSEFYELSQKSRGTDGLDDITTTDTNFNVFVDKLQKIINSGGTPHNGNLLVETGDPAPGSVTNELGKPDGSSNKKKNVEINTKFLRDVLQKISSSEQHMVLSQQFRKVSGTKPPGDVERKALERDSDSSFQNTPLLGETVDTPDLTGRKDYTKLPTVNKHEDIGNVKILLEDLKQVYTNYRKKYEKQGGDEKFESNYFKGDEAKDSKLLSFIITLCPIFFHKPLASHFLNVVHNLDLETLYRP